MWEPRRLTTPWAYTTCYRDNHTRTFLNYESLSLPLTEEAILTVFENKQQKRIFGQQAEKIAEK
jgi:hypothetical protein